MYKITKTICNTETINLVFDDAAKAQEVFHDLQYDEFVRFTNLYGSGINKERIIRKMDYDTTYKEYRFSVPTFSVTIILTYIKD